MAALRDFEASAAAGHASAAPAPPREDRGEGRGAWMADAVRSVSDLALVARCRAGERLAWKAVYEAHFEFVYRVARRLGTPAAEAEDVCQEVFLVAFRRLDSFNEGRFSSWLYRITANVVSDRHRKARVRRLFLAIFGGAGGEPEDPRSTPEHAMEARETDERVRQILERMAPKKREVFALYELEGLSGDDIADQVGCPIDTVWTRLHHARREFARLARQRGLLP